MKRLTKHSPKMAQTAADGHRAATLSSHVFKIPTTLEDIGPELTRLEELIHLIYAVYTGVLLYEFEEKKITSSCKIIREGEYRKMRDELLVTELGDNLSVIRLYGRCREELKTAIAYAKSKTGV
jgi:hypothetical protein